MKIIAIMFPVPVFGTKETEDKLCVAIHSTVEEMDRMVRTYPINNVKTPYIRFDDKEFLVFAELSEKVTGVKDGDYLHKKDLFWCDPKALSTFYAKMEYFPLEEYLFDKNRGGWISDKIYKKCIVERIL